MILFHVKRAVSRMVIRTQDPRQMDMFSMFSRDIDECRDTELPIAREVEIILPAGRIPSEIPSEESFSGYRWLMGLVLAKEHMIFLFYHGEDLYRVTCGSSWERRVPGMVSRAFVYRVEAENYLRKWGYVHHSNYSHENSRAKVYVRWWNNGKRR